MTTQALLRCCHLTTAETYEPSINWCFVSSSCAWLTVCWWISLWTFVWIWKSGWSSMVGSNWKPKISLFSCQKLKEEGWVRFKINEMLFYGLDSLKIYKVIYYTIVKEGCVIEKSASFSWKAVLVSPWWCHSKKADFSFVFTKSHVPQHIFLT